MRREAGDPSFPIWLLGDSNPAQWENVLDTPLDPRHPARHSIWTPVLERIQDDVYRLCGARLDTSSLYVRNAVADASTKPGGARAEWGPVTAEVVALRDLLDRYRPHLVLSFGAFSFEFTRRALGEELPRAFSYWGARRLGDEFRARSRGLEPGRIHLLPLLHVSIARGRFVQSHEYFCGEAGANYFEYVGNAIGDSLVRHRRELPVWIEREHTGSCFVYADLMRRLLQQPHLTRKDLSSVPTDQGVYVLWLDSNPPTCLKVGMAGPRSGKGHRGRLTLHWRSNPANTVLARHLMADSASTWARGHDFAQVEERQRFLTDRCYLQALPLGEYSEAEIRALEAFAEAELKPRYLGRVGKHDTA